MGRKDESMDKGVDREGDAEVTGSTHAIYEEAHGGLNRGCWEH